MEGVGVDKAGMSNSELLKFFKKGDNIAEVKVDVVGNPL